MLELKQSVTDKVIPFLLVSSTDHIMAGAGIRGGTGNSCFVW
jgi:hypothetical protein